MSRPDVKRQAQKNLAGLARSHTDKAIQTLVAAMDSQDERVRVDAASRILDRGYGKPAQSVDMTINDRRAEEMTDDELLSIAAGGSNDAAEAEEHTGLAH